ncbi:MAG: branched-chain amino acid ABC transporter permease [Rhodospirillales bacterium]|jgi:branched-chain amino acid transport system permease protein|nr:branched-chain amino acid ABC transporter permease [Rhodospirillales bacterium]MBT4038860.1 branched-chain amino acid ABC transporter permease [Rhodospirillales bacterium]MBT4627565.1 branched-chain amino acid ABC transporter permease [Rhodospirillales bacterium]MBT5351769.1 branched-chain amino acid ABC transporter permease [Rhodospirillales bacterium]MBT5521669.1 branched-chain amino acid ABC transporter permease [Rhodospirillales bacterium]
MEFSNIFWSVLAWMVFWAVVGSIVTRRVYLQRDLDTSNAGLAGSLLGASTGPIGLIYLWIKAPEVSSRMLVVPAIGAIGLFLISFALADPSNLCVTSGSFVASQISNGLIIGIIYGFMALGLTLIFSILGVVSFAHGEFYMIGGMITYFVTTVWFPDIGPIAGIAAACIATFMLGAIFERLFLTPMYSGKVDRPVEYGILITFGLAFTLQYFVQATVGANPVKAKRFFDFPSLRLPSAEDPWLIKTSRGNMELFETISISNPRFTAAVACILVFIALMYFLRRTWTGKALRAVSLDRDAAAIAGINPDRMNMLAFALGSMIAALAGAMLVQAFSWLPQVGAIPAMRSFVIVVLGGLGSIPGAFLGGVIVGLVEAAGTGCIPDAQKAASYIPAYGMIILTLTLLLRPTGLLGRKFSSGTHGKV